VPAATLTSSTPLYPDSAAFDVATIDTGEGHLLHIAEHGCADGLPALVLHGGPGSGCSPLLHRCFDPQRYRIVCLDQRGAGRSRPRGGIVRNDTGRLLADLRRLRTALAIDRWLVVGGSWGATLALLHAVDAPEAIAGLLLRASFLARAEDIDAFFAPLAPLTTLAAALASDDPAAARAAAAAWWAHEQSLATGRSASAPLAPDDLDRQVDRYRVQSHYLRHGCWLGERPLLARCAQVPRVPTLLLHGRADRVCPPDGATLLHARLPGSRLRWIDAAGHDPSHPAMAAAMVETLDRWADHGDFAPPP
jgi:proline iminopeptidase